MLEPLRRVDAAWLHMDQPRNTADIVSLLGFGRRVPLERVRALVEDRLLAHDRFKQRIHETVAGPAWEPDPSFSLERHIDHTTAADDEALRRLLSELATVPLDPGRPPWRIRVVETGQGAALVMKLHHCMADGHALMGLLRSMADAPVAELATAKLAFRDLGIRHDGWAGLLKAVTEPATAMRLARDASAFATSLTRLATLSFDRDTVLNRPLSGTRRVTWTQGLPLAAIREAAHRSHVSVNEFLLAALAGALRSVLAAAGDPVDAVEPRAMVPVNTRSGPAGAGLGNAFGLVLVDLPVRLSSPAARLAAVHARFDALRSGPDALVALAILGAMGFMPPPLERLGTSFFTRKASLVVTNVPGPPAPLRLGGEELERMMFWVPHLATLGLGVSILSYAGQVRIGVRADVATLEDPDVLARALEEEVARMGVQLPAARPATAARPGQVEAQASQGAPDAAPIEPATPAVTQPPAAAMAPEPAAEVAPATPGPTARKPRNGAPRAPADGARRRSTGAPAGRAGRSGSRSSQGARRSSGPGAPRANRITAGDQPLSPRGTRARGASEGRIGPNPRRS